VGTAAVEEWIGRHQQRGNAALCNGIKRCLDLGIGARPQHIDRLTDRLRRLLDVLELVCRWRKSGIEQNTHRTG